MRPLLRPLLLIAAASLGACTSTTEIRPDPDALDAAAQFWRLADDASRNGADPDVFVAYSNIAATVGRIGRVSPVTVVIDGTPLEFVATAQQMERDAGPACAAPGSLCLTLPPLRSVIAWQKSDPRRFVQLSALAGSTQIGPGAAASFSGDLQIASLTYFDGSGGIYRGTSGTLHIPDPATSDTPCRTQSIPDGAVSAPELEHCTRAEFTASVDATVAPPPFVVRGNTAAGTHTIAMASQPVHGARLVFPVYYSSPFDPPVDLRGGDLRATTTATGSASLVALELRVTNPQTAPVAVRFNTAQQYDFGVRRVGGATIWTWSADKGFTQALGSRTLAAGETATYTATWTPTEHGSFVADGWLTSTSHHAGGSAAFTVP